MSRARRYDASPLRSVKTSAGFLRGEARATRTGVFTYRNADGTTRRELRHPDEVFAPASLGTLALAPITNGHPTEAVTSKNARALSVGAVGDAIRADGRYVVAPFAIHDDAAIADVESNRKRELSCGYDCELEIVAGEYEGERYDAIQRSIVYNHLAIVERGRAGSEIRIDGADAVCVDVDDHKQEDKATTMKIKISGVDYEVPDQVAQAYTAHVDALNAKIDASAARADALTDKVQKLEAENAPAKIDARIKARVDLVSKATAVLGTDAKLDALTDDEIRRAVIVKVAPAAKLDGKSADYVSARYDHAIETFDADADDDADDDADASRAAVRTALAHTDASDDASADAARKKMVERNRVAWMPKASA